MIRQWIWVWLALAWSVPVFAAVDVNSASAQQLEAVKGIGPAKARAIIDYRTRNGPFRSLDDLSKVDGIGPKSLEKMRPELQLGAKPPAKPAVPKPAIRK